MRKGERRWAMRESWFSSMRAGMPTSPSNRQGFGDLDERIRVLLGDPGAGRLASDTGQFSLAGAQAKTALYRTGIHTGEVAEVGPGVSGWKRDDRVAGRFDCSHWQPLLRMRLLHSRNEFLLTRAIPFGHCRMPNRSLTKKYTKTSVKLTERANYTAEKECGQGGTQRRGGLPPVARREQKSRPL